MNPTLSSPIRVGFAFDFSPAQRERIEAAHPLGFEVLFLGADWRDDATIVDLDVLVIGNGPVKASDIERAPRLRLIQRWGTGIDNIDLTATASRNIAVAELPGANARSVAEFVLLAVLALLRHLPEMAVAWSRGQWVRGRPDTPPRRLTGMTVGLLGFGSIGQDVARLLTPFDVELLVHDRLRPDPSFAGVMAVTRSDLLRRSDVLCVQLPLTDETRGAIGAAEIMEMKSDAVLVSVSRSGIVDEAAVREAVLAGRLAAAGFDNFAAEPLPAEFIRHQPGILATPHVAGAAAEAFDQLLPACFESIRARCPAAGNRA